MKTTVMLPSRNDRAPGFVVIGNAGNRRVELFQHALKALGLPPAQLVLWRDFLKNFEVLDRILATVPPDTVIRIESPEKDFEVERVLLAIGADQDDPDAQGVAYERICRRAVETLTFEKGRILPSRQWYLGFRHVLHQLAQHLSGV